MDKKIQLMLLLFLLIVGVWLRISGTLQGNFAFTYDQGRDFLAVKNLVYERNLTLIGPTTGIDGVFHGVWWYWLLAPVFLLMQGNPQLVTLLFNVLTAGAIILAFALGKNLKGVNLGLLMAGFTAVSPYFISTSAQVWNPYLLPCLTLLFYLVLSLKIPKNIKAFGSGLLIGAIFEFAIGSGILVIIAAGLSLAILRVKINQKQAFLAMGGFIVLLIPRVIFELRHGFIQTSSFIRYFLQGNTSGNINFLSNFLTRPRTLFSIFKNAFGFNSQILTWLMVLLILFFFVFRIKQVKWQRLPLIIRLSIVVSLLMFVEAIFFPAVLWDYYLVAWPALLLPFIAWVMTDLIKFHKALGWTVLILFSLLGFWPEKFIPKAWEGDASVYKNQIRVVERIYTDAAMQKFNLEVFSPSVIDYNYQYLFGWLGKTKKNTPDRQTVLPLVYYIIEPDLWNKGLRELWIKDRLHDGQIVWDEELAGGIEVQRRWRDLNRVE